MLGDGRGASSVSQRHRPRGHKGREKRQENDDPPHDPRPFAFVRSGKGGGLYFMKVSGWSRSKTAKETVSRTSFADRSAPG